MNRHSLSGVLIPLFFSILFIFPAMSNSDPLDNWHWRDLLPQTVSRPSGVTYGNGTFVVVGDNLILTSPDGVIWTQRTRGSYLSGVCYGNGIFVAVGGTILTSPDGVTWTQRFSGLSYDLRGVTYGNGTFVAVGGSYRSNTYVGTILTSPDGITWTVRDPGPSNGLTGVAYGSGIFIAVGSCMTTLASSDGVSWTKVMERSLCFAEYLNAITHGNGVFVSVGEWEHGGYIYTFSDGLTWEETRLGHRLHGVAYGNGSFVAVGYDGAIYSSSDGKTWVTRHLGGTALFLAVTYGDGSFLAVGDLGIIAQSDSVIIDNNFPLIFNLESPRSGQTISGITTIHGWALDGKGITKVELFIDDQSFGNIPYGSTRMDVRNVYPKYPDSLNSGFGMIMNYSILSAGSHTIKVRLSNQDGQTKDAEALVVVKKFHGDYVESVTPSGYWLRNRKVTADGITKNYKIKIEWSLESQGFQITDIIPK